MGETKIMTRIGELCRFERRGPTLEGEREACRYLEGEMRGLGLATSVEEFRANPHFYWAWFTHMVIGLSALVASVWVPWAGFGLAVAGMLFFWGDLSTRFYVPRGLLPKGVSRNLIGRLEKEGAERLIVLTAHYDAARAGKVVFNPELDEKVAVFWKKHVSSGSTVGLMLPMVAAFAIAAVTSVLRVFLSGTGALTGIAVAQSVAGLIFLAAAAAFLDIAVGDYVAGANDNASGVAAALRVVERAIESPLEKSELWFLATGGEEAGLMGMLAFGKRHFREMDPENTFFINIDTVGCGTIRYATAEGFVWAERHREEMVSVVEGLKERGEFPEIKPLKFRQISDGLVPLKKGFKALTLICLDENNYVHTNHNETDVPENVDPDVVSRAADLAWRVVRELDDGSPRPR